MHLHVYTRFVVTQVWIEKPRNKNIEIGFQNAVFTPVNECHYCAIIEARMQRPLFRARENRQSTCQHFQPIFNKIREIIKGWMTRRFFLAYQNQHVSKPTWVKLQCTGHSTSTLKSMLKMAKLASSEKHFKKGRALSAIYMARHSKFRTSLSRAYPNIWGTPPPLTHSWDCTQAQGMGLEWENLLQLVKSLD